MGATLRLKPDRRQITLGGYRRHTDRIPAATWMRIADAMNRLQDAAATAEVQRASGRTLYNLGAGRELFLTVEGITLSALVVNLYPFTLRATISSEPIPEPTTLTLVGIGIAGLVGHARWRHGRRQILKTEE